MRLLLALALIAWTSTCARDLVFVLLPPWLRDPWTTRLSALAAGWGAVTLVPAWIMIASGSHAFPAAVAATFALALAGWLARHGRQDRPRPPGAAAPTPLEWLLRSAVGAVCVAILLNAASWPFDIGDALALYAPFGRHLYERAALPVGDGIYEAYPMLVPMAFALTHWVTGGVNEYVARLVPALLALGAVGAAGLLGAAIADRRAGLLAAALTACSPIFGRWASTGYTDVPAAFFATLAIVFTWHWWRSADRYLLALASIGIGLALWTKNSTVPLLVSLAWLIAWRACSLRRHAPRARTVLADAAAAFGPALAVAGPWYAHAWHAFGVLMPSTMLVDRADRSPASLAIMLRPDQHFGVAGVVFTAAVAYAGWQVLRKSGARRDRWHQLLAFVVPFGGAWWWFASYEARFLMVLVPALAAMGAAMLIDLAEHLGGLAPAGRVRRALLLLAGALVVAGAAASVRKSIEHKPKLLRQPFMSDAERHRVRLGGLYDLAGALNELEPGSRVGGVPRIIAYHLDSRRVPMMSWAPLLSAGSAVCRYDYVVLSPRGADAQMPPCRGTLVPVLTTGDGYRLYRIEAARPARTR